MPASRSARRCCSSRASSPAVKATCCSAVSTAPVSAIPSSNGRLNVRRPAAASAWRCSAAAAAACSDSIRSTARSTCLARSDGYSRAPSGSTSASTARATSSVQCLVRCSSTRAWCSSSSPAVSISSVRGSATVNRKASCCHRSAVICETFHDPAISSCGYCARPAFAPTATRSSSSTSRRTLRAQARASSRSRSVIASSAASCAASRGGRAGAGGRVSSGSGSMRQAHRTHERGQAEVACPQAITAAQTYPSARHLTAGPADDVCWPTPECRPVQQMQPPTQPTLVHRTQPRRRRPQPRVQRTRPQGRMTA